jgi:hypothetical protein
MNFIAKLMNNSLYGKFGQSPNLSTAKIINKDELESFVTNSSYEITDIQEFGATALVQFRDLTLNHEDRNQNVNVGISAAITAYARIFLSKYLTDPNLIIYYMDTDSFIVNEMPDQSEIGKGLGQWKHEKDILEYASIAAKVYAGIYKTPNIEEIKEFAKVKGFVNKNDTVKLNDIKNLLIKNESLELTHQT